MKFKWIYLWNGFFWIILVGCSIQVIFAIPTLERWKWGYYSLDMIPPVLIILFLAYVNIIIEMNGLYNRINKLEDATLTTTNK